VVTDLLLALFGLAIAAVLSFWGWLAIRVIDQGRKIAELEQRINAQSQTCVDRLAWMRSMEQTLNRVAQDTLAIRVAMGEPPHID